MHILIISQYFWPESFRINDLAHGLRNNGHRVSVLTGMPNYPNGRLFAGYRAFMPMGEDYDGIEVKRVPLVTRGNGQTWRLILNYASFAVLASILAPLRCRDTYDLIFVYEPSPITVGLPAMVMRKLRNIPIMFWVQDLWPESLSATGAVKSPRILALVQKMVRFIYQHCDRILVQSKGFVDRVVAAGAERDAVEYLPNWAEDFYKALDQDQEEAASEELPHGFRVMFAGNIGSAQAFGTILAAAEKLRDYPEIQWLIVGDGHRRKWVEKRVRRRNLSQCFHFLGRKPAEQMPHYFAMADALLVTLIRDPIFALTIPSKIQSYLACGRPIVAALDGEGKAVVEEAQAGLTSPAEDADGLAEAVLALYRMDPAERHAMGARGRLYYEQQFARERSLGNLERWMKEVVEKTACVS